MRILDRKFRRHVGKYMLQCALATVIIVAVLLSLNVLTHTAIIATLGATTFIVFTMPQSYFSQTRVLLGGYTVGIAVGIFFHYLSTTEILQIMSEEILLIVFGGISVGIAIFLMSITNTEHAPAAGIALGLVLNEWNYLTVGVIIGSVLLLCIVREILGSSMMDLREL